jgi:hypothetical protein
MYLPADVLCLSHAALRVLEDVDASFSFPLAASNGAAEAGCSRFAACWPLGCPKPPVERAAQL